jgi:hypothetical protein
VNIHQNLPRWGRLTIMAAVVALVAITYELHKRRSSFVVVTPVVGQCLTWNKANRAWENATCGSTDDTYLPGQ